MEEITFNDMLLRLRASEKYKGMPLSVVALDELLEWHRVYTPPPEVPKDGLVVDIGAKEGDSAVFFFLLGYRNFRLVEPFPRNWPVLKHTAELLVQNGCKVELCLERFQNEKHLQGAAFVKFDCEGCEWEIDLDSLAVPWAAEIHTKVEPDKDGIYPYHTSTGFRRGGK